MLRPVVLAGAVALLSVFCAAQAKTNVYKVTSPIQSLNTQLGANMDGTMEPYKSGEITPDTKSVAALLTSLNADPKKTTIVHPIALERQRPYYCDVPKVVFIRSNTLKDVFWVVS